MASRALILACLLAATLAPRMADARPFLFAGAVPKAPNATAPYLGLATPADETSMCALHLLPFIYLRITTDIHGSGFNLAGLGVSIPFAAHTAWPAATITANIALDATYRQQDAHARIAALIDTKAILRSAADSSGCAGMRTAIVLSVVLSA